MSEDAREIVSEKMADSEIIPNCCNDHTQTNGGQFNGKSSHDMSFSTSSEAIDSEPATHIESGVLKEKDTNIINGKGIFSVPVLGMDVKSARGLLNKTAKESSQESNTDTVLDFDMNHFNEDEKKYNHVASWRDNENDREGVLCNVLEGNDGHMKKKKDTGGFAIPTVFDDEALKDPDQDGNESKSEKEEEPKQQTSFGARVADFVGRVSALVVMVIATVQGTLSCVTNFAKQDWMAAGLALALLLLIQLPVTLILCWVMCKAKIRFVANKLFQKKRRLDPENDMSSQIPEDLESGQKDKISHLKAKHTNDGSNKVAEKGMQIHNEATVLVHTGSEGAGHRNQALGKEYDSLDCGEIQIVRKDEDVQKHSDVQIEEAAVMTVISETANTCNGLERFPHLRRNKVERESNDTGMEERETIGHHHVPEIIDSIGAVDKKRRNIENTAVVKIDVETEYTKHLVVNLESQVKIAVAESKMRKLSDSEKKERRERSVKRKSSDTDNHVQDTFGLNDVSDVTNLVDASEDGIYKEKHEKDESGHSGHFRNREAVPNCRKLPRVEVFCAQTNNEVDFVDTRIVRKACSDIKTKDRPRLFNIFSETRSSLKRKLTEPNFEDIETLEHYNVPHKEREQPSKLATPTKRKSPPEYDRNNNGVENCDEKISTIHSKSKDKPESIQKKKKTQRYKWSHYQWSRNPSYLPPKEEHVNRGFCAEC